MLFSNSGSHGMSDWWFSPNFVFATIEGWNIPRVVSRRTALSTYLAVLFIAVKADRTFLEDSLPTVRGRDSAQETATSKFMKVKTQHKVECHKEAPWTCLITVLESSVTIQFLNRDYWPYNCPKLTVLNRKHNGLSKRLWNEQNRHFTRWYEHSEWVYQILPFRLMNCLSWNYVPLYLHTVGQRPV